MSDAERRRVNPLVRRWEAEDRKRGQAFLRERREKHERFWREAKGPIEAVWERLNDPRRHPTPQVTVEAIMYCVRERGLAALKEPANQERLSRCDPRAREQINGRIGRLQAAGRLPNESQADGKEGLRQ